MKRNLLRLSIVVLMFAMLLSGCASTGSTTSAAGGTTGTTTAAATPAAKDVTLNIFIPQPRFREQYEAYLDKFVAKYKADTGVNVKYELEMPSADTASEILKTRLTTGADLDVFSLHAINEIPQFYKAGYLLDLSAEPWVSTLYDSVKTAVTIDKKVVALPLESLTWGYLYNKALFAQLNLKPAMTLTEMKANIAAIKGAGKTPFLASYNESWIPQLFLPLTVGGFATTTNTDFIAKMNASTGSFADLKGMFDIIDLANANSNKDGLEIGGNDGCAKFATGDYGMWVQGPWFSATILQADPKFEFGVAPLPVSDNAEQTKINASVSTSLAVCSTSKNPEVAKALVAFFLNDKESSAFFEAVQFNPLSSVHTFKSSAWIDEANTYLKSGKAYVDLPIPQAVKDESGKILQAYYGKTVTQAEVIKSLDDAWKTYNKVNQ
jgi:raffinose/stachyose/melibiose transport system substrate-binding protein